MSIGTKEGFLIFQEQKGNSPSSEREWTLSKFYNCGGCSIVCCNNNRLVIVAGKFHPFAKLYFSFQSGEVDETLCDIENSPRIARIYKVPSEQGPIVELTQIARVGFEIPILKIHLYAGLYGEKLREKVTHY